MTQDQLNAFLSAVSADSQLKNKLSEAVDAESVVRVAEEAGFSLPLELIEKMHEGFKNELSEKELESVSGGTMDPGAALKATADFNHDSPTAVIGICIWQKVGQAAADGVGKLLS